MYVVGSCCLYVACARVHTSIYIYIYIYEIEICLLIVMTDDFFHELWSLLFFIFIRSGVNMIVVDYDSGGRGDHNCIIIAGKFLRMITHK